VLVGVITACGFAAVYITRQAQISGASLTRCSSSGSI
jgi:hypothetical protein